MQNIIKLYCTLFKHKIYHKTKHDSSTSNMIELKTRTKRPYQESGYVQQLYTS